MKYFFTILTAVLLSTSLRAQEPEKPPEYGWKHTLVSGLNLSQVSLHNWVQGGENTFAWTFLTTGKFLLAQEKFNWSNSLKLTYGQTKIGSQDFEKTDDEFFFESVLSYVLGIKVDPYVAVLARHQMAPGYKDINGVRTQTSGFFDPGYLMQSAGFMYAPSESFNTRLGIAVKETFASKFSQYGYADDPSTPEIEKTRVQTGIESATSASFTLMENILFTSLLNLFSAFNKLDTWDVRWDNTISAKVNKYVTASLSFQVLHEVAQTRRTQMKQALAVGLSYTIF